MRLELRPDLDAVEALSPEREALWARLEKSSFLTADEKRSAVGYDCSLPAALTEGHVLPRLTLGATLSAIAPCCK